MKNHKMRRSLKLAGMVAVDLLHSTIRAVKGLVDMPLGTRNIAGMALIADNTANVPNVVLMEDPNRILASAGYGRGGGVVELVSAGGKVDTKEIYFTDKLGNRHGGIIRVGQYVYGDLDDSGRIWCAEAKTGKIMWTRKDDSEGGGSASIT